MRNVQTTGLSLMVRCSVVALTAALTLAPLAAHASSDEPAGINLGGTSYTDGFGGTTPDFIYQQYFQIENYSAINDTTQHNVPVFKNPDISVVVSLNQLIYVSPIKIFGGSLGGTALLPVVDLNSSFAADSPAKLTANKGLALGDLTFGPFIQFAPVIVGGRPVFSARAEFDTIAPIGLYDPHKDINPSSGFWSINPYLAMTFLPTPNTEMSFRVHYLHNFENHNAASSDPAVSGTSFQAGDASWVNFTGSYKVAEKLSIGINGYYFKQFTDDTAEGVVQKGTETTNLSVGPGAVYALNEKNIFFANAYLPVIEKNTVSGFHLVFRWIHVF